VAIAHRAHRSAQRELPGTALPLLDASLYARTTGYMKARLVDIGDRVQEGQVLAVISAPDVDDQLNQAKANLAQAKANLPLAQANADLARITLERDRRASTAVSPLQLDQEKAMVQTTRAQVEAARAAIDVNEAAVQRYTDLQGFQKIIAPFPGVITARNVDRGDLVAADSVNGTREMFHIMRTDILRVFVNVPQVYSTDVQVGQEAIVFRREDPRKQVKGKVTRTANALDPNSRTLRTEVQVHNTDNSLRPGMYLQVRFVFDRGILPVCIPSAALATRTGAPRVAILDREHRVQYRTIETGRDYGAEIEVLNGVQAGERVIVHPGDDLEEGTLVEPVTSEKT
jgi:RND family efflux transporter MFP subunit